MARYQLLRPSPVRIFPRRVRRQDAVTSSAPAAPEQPEAEEPEEAEGPESPDSPDSSGGESSDSDSDSENEQEPPSPVESTAPPTEQGALPPAPAPNSTTITSSAATTLASQTASPPPPPPAFTISFSSRGNLGAAPQITDPALASSAEPASPTVSASSEPASPTEPASSTGLASSTSIAPSSNPAPTTFTTRPTTTSSLTDVIFVSSSFSMPGPSVPTVSTSASSTIAAVLPPSSTASSTLSSNLPLPPAQSETAGSDSAPQTTRPQQEKTMISKGGVAAAIALSVIGAIAILVAAFICMKRRKRRQNQYAQRLDDDAINPNNTGSLHAPETAHISVNPPFLGGGSHLTRSTDRSNSLFGAGAYQRPETVSTDRNKSRFPVAPPQPTPNPFADPPLKKAYDVLAGRPRSTTLTDRGSWVKNPFRNPESERFDPFGELQEKAREERRRYLEESRKEAEDARIRETERQFGMKEAMGLGMPEQARKGSGATVGGLGVLDRSGGLR